MLNHRARLVAALALAVVTVGCVGEEAKHKAAGNIFFHNGDLVQAEREYRAAISAAPSDANGHTLLGNVLFEAGKLDDAARAYGDALTRDPRAREARRGLATVALRNGDQKGARRMFEAIVDEAPSDSEAQAALGKVLLSQGDFGGAEAHLRSALAGVSNDPSTLYCLGVALGKQHQRGEALSIFDRLEAATPGQAFAPYGRALVAAAAGDADEAIAWLRKALASGIDDLDGVTTDPAFAQLHADARFTALVDQARQARQAGAARSK